jgi:hypothetical protein
MRVARHQHPEVLLLSCAPTEVLPAVGVRETTVKSMLTAMGIQPQGVWQSKKQHQEAQHPGPNGLPARLSYYVLPH